MPPDSLPIVFRSPHRRTCKEACLVLEAVGIAFELIHQQGWWCVLVNESDYEAAIKEIDEYRQDTGAEPTPVPEPIPLFGGAILGVVFYLAVLVAVFVLDQVSAYSVLWSEVGAMRSERVMAGQWWRTVTALTLHADTSHLFSNLAFGSLFGLLVGRVLGGGVGWLTIVVAGGLGNFANAVIRGGGHVSIGASTAVFAMLGILVAHALRPRATRPPSPLQRWSPLIAGVLMFAFIGLEGERTDVLAHSTGFVAGLLLGWLGSGLPQRWLASDSGQFSAAVATGVLLLVAWAMAAMA
jgi:membrane associated rhomboid family serine protease